MSPLKRFDAAIFDMDGLLLDSEPLWRQVSRRIYATVDVLVDDDFLSQTEGLRLVDSIQLVYGFKPFSKKTRERIGEEITDAMCDMIRSHGEALPGVYRTLQFFRSRGIPVALASSSGRRVIAAVVDKLSLEGCFAVTRSGEQESEGKPSPQIFLSTARELRADPSRCVVFEDSVNGVLAAKAAGMFCIAVPDPRGRADPRFAIADARLGSLEEFEESVLDHWAVPAQESRQ